MNFILELRRQTSNKNERAFTDPLDPNFDPTEFHRVFQSFQDGSSQDQSARIMGEFTGTQVKGLNLRLEKLESKTQRVGYRILAEAVADYLNQQFIAIHREQSAVLFSSRMTTAETLGSVRSTHDNYGNKYTPAAVLEQLLNSANFLLLRTIDNNGFGRNDPEYKLINLRDVLQDILRLGCLIDFLRERWHRVLWNGAIVQIDSNSPCKYSFDERATCLATTQLIEINRRDIHKFRNSNQIEIPRLNCLFNLSKCLTFENQTNGERWLKTSNKEELSSTFKERNEVLSKSFSSMIESSLEEFIKGYINESAGVKYSDLLRAWYALTFLAIQDSQEISDSINLNNLPIERYGTKIQAKRLEVELASVLKLELEQAKFIIQFLTFRGKGQEFWTNPILDSEQWKILLWHPLIYVNPVQLIHSWATGGDIKSNNYSDKGYKFEHFIHSKLVGFEKNSVVPFTTLSPKIIVRDKNHSTKIIGEIDVAFVIENTLFILECRMMKEPAGPLQFGGVQKDLNKKQSQITRIKDYLLENLHITESWLSRDKRGNIPKINNIVALVVSNSFLNEGSRESDPYFIHYSTLVDVLNKTFLEYSGGPFRQNYSIIYRTRILDTKLPMTESVVEAFRNPIDSEIIKKCIVNRDISIRPFDDSECTISIMTRDFQWPESAGQLKEVLKLCSFWSRTKRIRPLFICPFGLLS